MTQDPLSSEQSDTPKTDMEAFFIEHAYSKPVVTADFARAQERRIAELVQAATLALSVLREIRKDVFERGVVTGRTQTAGEAVITNLDDAIREATQP